MTTGFNKYTLAMTLCVTLTGCGFVYNPQSLEVNNLDYGYHKLNDVDLELLPLTLATVREANADGYKPRGLPAIFDLPTDDLRGGLSVRERYAAAGLDTPDAAFELPPFPATAGTGYEVLPPYQRRTDRRPGPVVDVRGGGVNPVLRQTGAGVGLPPADDMDAFNAASTSVGAPRRVSYNPPPAVEPEPYRIGPGDVIGLLSKLQRLNSGSEASAYLADATRRLLVQGNGEIFIPQAGAVDVGGLTLTEARRAIFDQLVNNQLDFDFGVEIVEFGSQKVAVSGPTNATLLPITVRPVTLGEAVIAVGGLGRDPSNMVVRVLRGGSIYEVPGARLDRSADIANRILMDGDVVSVAPIYDLDQALRYFDQQLRLREINRSPFDDALRNRADQRAGAAEARAQVQFEIEMETYRLESERLRQEAELARFEAARSVDEANEAARIANIEARQAYLDRLYTLQEANRQAARQAELDRRRTLRDNASARAAVRAQARAERQAMIQLEIEEERNRIARLTEQRRLARDLFTQRLDIGALQQDYVTIAGETIQQAISKLPFEGVTTLNEVLYNEGRGINPVSGDTSEIYVLRHRNQGGNSIRIVAYHLDASTPVGLSVASLFEMRPNDVVFVNPQPVTNWNRVISQLLPSTSLVGTATSLATQFSGN